MRYTKQDMAPAGIIVVYTGDGKGKTTSALGIGMRAAGHGQKAVMVQFMKKKGCAGEHYSAILLAPNFELHAFGRDAFVNPKKLDEIDMQLARECLEYAEHALKREPDILILDEVNVAVSMGLIPLAEVIELIKHKPKNTSIILTGRNAPKELIELADIATEMCELKHHYHKGFGAKPGIDS